MLTILFPPISPRNSHRWVSSAHSRVQKHKGLRILLCYPCIVYNCIDLNAAWNWRRMCLACMGVDPYGTRERPFSVWIETCRCECPIVSGISFQKYTKCDCYSDFVTSFTWTQILRASWWRGFYIPSNVSPAGLPIRLAPSFLRLIFGFCWPLGAFLNYTTYLFTYLSGLQAETCCGNSCFRPPVVTCVPQSLRRIDSSSSITVLAGMLDRTCCDITVKNHLEIVCHAQRCAMCIYSLLWAWPSKYTDI